MYPIEKRSLWLGWGLGAGAALLYLLTMQRQLWGDGLFFYSMLEAGGARLFYNHALYLPLTKLLQIVVSVVVPIDVEVAMKVTAALAGGVGVALTFFVARAMFVPVCGDRPPNAAPAAVAVTLALLLGQWFHSTAAELHSLHAACAAFLLLRLLRLLQDAVAFSWWDAVLLGVAVLLTPGSHVSGVVVGLPLLGVFVCAKGARLRLTVAATVGFSGFAAYYLWFMQRQGGLDGFTTGQVERHVMLVDDLGEIPGILLSSLGEYGLYSTPAFILLPAGLRVLFRSAPKYAWLCLSWCVAWPLIAWPFTDTGIGSYYTPTYPVQVFAAACALQGLARHRGLVLGALLLSALPAALSFFVNWTLLGLDGVSGPLLVATPAAAVVFFAVRDPGARPPLGGLWGMAVLTLAISAPPMTWFASKDKFRDRIREVEAYIDAVDAREDSRSLVIFLAVGTPGHHHWLTFFEGGYYNYDRAFNPVFASLLPEPEERDRRLRAQVAALDRAMAAGRPVWLEGSIARATERVGGAAKFGAFAGALMKYRMEPLADGPANLVRLRSR